MDHVKPRRPPGNAARARLPWRGLAMALMLLLGAMASAHAQIGGGHGRRQNNQQQTPQRSPAPTTPFLGASLAPNATSCQAKTGEKPFVHRGIRFAHDSLLEEAGFEPSVPRPDTAVLDAANAP
jgi:hypothetical protein